MANVTETPSYDAGIYQIETTDPVLGGPNGIANAQAKGLANRTAFLKQQIDQLNSGQLTPTWIASQDYVQEQLQKLDVKQSVRAATTANITLSGIQTIDGVALTVGDRVLVKDQTNSAQNGIYLAAAQGWTRATDSDIGAKLNGGARVAVEEGGINAGKVWYLATTGSISVGSTALLFVDEHSPATELARGITRYATQAEVDEPNSANQKDDAVVTVKKLWAWVKNASESVLGMIRIATQSQTNAGTADDVAVTPKKLRGGFTFSDAGFLLLPSWMGGYVLQWGFLSVSASSGVITYPVALASSPFVMLPSNVGSAALTSVVTFGYNATSTTSVTWYSTQPFLAGANGFGWFLIGKAA